MDKGQTLVEMIVVIGVVIILVTGIIAGTSASLSRANDSELRSSAIRYAQEGIELARQMRDSGWTAFAALGAAPTTYCVGDDAVFTPSVGSCSTPNINNLYVRSITLRLVAPGDPTQTKVTVDVVVTWGGSTANNVELKTDLTQWR